MPDSIMTLAEVAQYLKLGERTVLKMVHAGEIPGARIGNQWRFIGSVVDQWLKSKTGAPIPSGLSRLIEEDDSEVPLSRLVRPGYILLDLKPDTVRGVLNQLVHPFMGRGDITQRESEQMERDLLRREEIQSTAVGKGVAFPHLRSPELSPIPGPLVLVGRCPEGSNFGSSDGRLTRLFFLVATNSVVVHLRILARITHAVEHTKIGPVLLQAETEDDVLAAFLRID